MDRSAFHHLVLNAGCLAERALVRALVRALQCASETPAAPMAGDGLQLSLPASPDELDWGALDGLSLGRPEAAQLPPDEDEASAADEAERAELSLLYALGPPAVYEAAAPFACRHDRLLARADLAHLAELLAALPADAAPLNGPLSAADFARWCSRLDADAGPLHALIAALRSLDPPL